MITESSFTGQDFHVHSTPAVQRQTLTKDGDNDTGYCRNSECSTDLSTLSSNSARQTTVGERADAAISAHSERMIEDQLCREFSMKTPTRDRKKGSQKSRKGHHSFEEVGDIADIGKTAHRDGYRERQSVIKARGGSSQSDLAANAGHSESRSRETVPRPLEGDFKSKIFVSVRLAKVSRFSYP